MSAGHARLSPVRLRTETWGCRLHRGGSRGLADRAARGGAAGAAGAVLLLGGAVRGGRVVADWPGLGPDDLYEGRNLRPTTDVRAVFKCLLVDHLGIDPAYVERQVFPRGAGVPRLERLAGA